jgi:hypothetical protein
MPLESVPETREHAASPAPPGLSAATVRRNYRLGVANGAAGDLLYDLQPGRRHQHTGMKVFL